MLKLTKEMDRIIEEKIKALPERPSRNQIKAAMGLAMVAIAGFIIEDLNK